MKVLSLYIILLLFSTVADAQNRPDSSLHQQNTSTKSDTKQLTEVIISYPKFNVATKSDTMSKVNRLSFSGRFLSDILLSQSNAYIKQQAPGQLSTISLNGGTASQTQLMWNGISINNAVTGLTDFSLIPVAIFDDISVVTGTTGVTGGSGSISGSVLLENRHQGYNSNLVKGGFHYGNFGRYSFNAGFALRKIKSGFSVHLFNTLYRNNYPYFDLDGEKRFLENAQIKGMGGIGSFNRTTKRGEFSSMLWIQENKREVPGTILQSNVFSHQRDVLVRFLNTYKLGRNGNTYFNLGYLNDQIEYYNGFDNLPSKANLHTCFTEAKTGYIIRNVKNIIKLSGHLFLAENTGYNNPVILPRFSVLYGLEENVSFFEHVVYNWSLSIREEINALNFSPPILQGGIELSLKQRTTKMGTFSMGIKLGGGSVFRFPTLNEMYWMPGGNPNLKPEKGLSANTTFFSTLLKPKKYDLKVEFTHYQRYMFDMIVWLPNGSVWSPNNIMEVWSRGNETRFFASFFDKCQLKIDSRLNYTLSTPVKTKMNNDASIGRQMLYIPMYTARIEPSVTYKKITLAYLFSYTGYRYTSTDNYEYLTPFHLHTARLSYGLQHKSFSAHIYFEVENLTNQTYQLVALRPAMPRNFMTGLQFNFHKIKRSNDLNNYEELL